MADGNTNTREKRLLSWADEIAALVSVQRDDLRRSRMELAAAQQVCTGHRAGGARIPSCALAPTVGGWMDGRVGKWVAGRVGGVCRRVGGWVGRQVGGWVGW